jgi:hypothetical protein
MARRGGKVKKFEITYRYHESVRGKAQRVPELHDWGYGESAASFEAEFKKQRLFPESVEVISVKEAAKKFRVSYTDKAKTSTYLHQRIVSALDHDEAKAIVVRESLLDVEIVSVVEIAP